MVELGELIRITTRVSVGSAPRVPFGRGLLVTNAAGLPASGTGKGTLFANTDEVRAVFGAGPVTNAATVWFSGDPPPQSLWIGRWADVDVDTELRGGTPGTVESLMASNGTFELNGHVVTVDTSSAGSYTAIASAIQTAIRNVTGFSSATFSYVTDRFVLGAGGTVTIQGGRLANTAADNDTDIADGLGMGPTSNTATYLQGGTAESVAAAVAAVRAAAGSAGPILLMLAPDTPLTDPTTGEDTRAGLAAYAEANDMVFLQLDTSSDNEVTGDSTTQNALAYGRSQGMVGALYSMAGEVPDVGAAAALSAQNLDNPQSIITLHAKSLPGVLPTPLDTAAALDELTRKRTSVYTLVDGQPAMVGGYASRDGYWLDAVYWLLWFKNRMQTAIWAAQRRARRFNRAQLTYELSRAGEAGVSNGGLEPNRKVNSEVQAEIIATTRNQGFDGILSAGYLVWVDPDPSDQDLENRIARYKMWATGAPAVHRVFGDMIFQN